MSTESETGWLLEKMHEGNVRYIRADYVLEWTDDPGKALRLARREDGEALSTIVEDCEKIAEHEWQMSGSLVKRVRNTTFILLLWLGSLWLIYNRSYAKGFEHGKAAKDSEIAGCTLANAREGKCDIPCESYFDCVAKNGHPEREY